MESPLERDSDSQQPLISDDEDEQEGMLQDSSYSIQQPDQDLGSEEAPAAVGFLKAFCLPGVLPVSGSHTRDHMRLRT